MRWPVKKLGNFIEIVMGQAPHSDQCNKEGEGVVFVKAGEFGIESPVIREWTTDPLKMAKADDTLICVVGATAGKINRSRFECAIGRSVAAVRTCAKEVEQNYLHAFLSTKVIELRNRSQGAAQAVITREMLQDIEIPLPPLAEQRRIAALLDTAEEIKRKREQAIVKIESFEKSLFCNFLFDCRHKEKYFFSDFAIDMHQGINTITEEVVYQNSGIPIIQSKHITKGYLDLDDARFLSEKDFVHYREKYKPKKNDILLCNIGTIGKSILVEDSIDFLIAWNLFMIKIDENKANPIFVKYYLDLLFDNHFFDKFLTGGTVKFVSKKTMLSIPFELPSLLQQNKFVLKINVAKNIKRILIGSQANLTRLYDSLQNQAFTTGFNA